MINDNDNDVISVNSDSSVSPIFSTHHWHASAVSSLSFSQDGMTLFSGGEEAVLVIWHIRSKAASDKSYFPRLGAPITHLSDAM